MTTITAPEPYITHQSDAWWYGNSLFEFLVPSFATAGAIAVFRSVMPEGFSPPRHIHTREDEVFLVEDGDLVFDIDGAVLQAGPGTSVFMPRGVPHTFRVQSATATVLGIMTPGNFDSLFRELGMPAGGAHAARARHGPVRRPARDGGAAPPRHRGRRAADGLVAFRRGRRKRRGGARARRARGADHQPGQGAVLRAGRDEARPRQLLRRGRRAADAHDGRAARADAALPARRRRAVVLPEARARQRARVARDHDRRDRRTARRRGRWWPRTSRTSRGR